MVATKADSGTTGIRRGLMASIAAAVFAIQIGSGAAQTQRDPQAMAQDAIRRLDLQTEVTRTPEFRISLPPELLWVVIAVALGALLYAFSDMIPLLRSRGSDSWSGDEAIATDIMRKDPAVALAAADALARQGRYAEAMHILLLRGLADIRARLDEPFADSLTSREILRSTRLPDMAREPLRDVVGRVEWTYFGEYPAGQEDYAACRTSFNAIEHALHRSASA